MTPDELGQYDHEVHRFSYLDIEMTISAAREAWEADRKRLAWALELLRNTVSEPDVPHAMGRAWIDSRDAVLSEVPAATP